MKKCTLLFTVLMLFSTFKNYAQTEGDSLFNNSILHEIRIEFEGDDFWNTLLTNYFMNGLIKADNPSTNISGQQAIFNYMRHTGTLGPKTDIEFLKANITIDNHRVDSVGVRLKGFSSFFAAEGYKKSLKVDFDAYIDTQNIDGVKKINLNNGVGDPSMQRDFISYHMLHKAGIAVPRVSFAKVYLNNQYWGLYTIVEQIDQSFLTRNFASGKGNLFKTIGWNQLEYLSNNFNFYKDIIELKTNEDKADGSDYVTFVKAINTLNNTNFTDSIQKLFNIDYYFKVLAIDIISKNWDSYLENNRNFYLYHEPVSDLFYWIPWDYNLAWDGTFNSWTTGTDTCSKFFNYQFETVDTTLNYYIELDVKGLTYLSIDFGDGSRQEWNYPTSDDNPHFAVNDVHPYTQRGIYNTYIYAGYDDNCSISKFGKVYMMDTTQLQCRTILKMNQVYYANDTLYKKVFERDHFCCDCQWDLLCQSFYYSYPDTNINDIRYAINYNSPKVLIQKILNYEPYRQRYFDVFKFILDSVFIEEELINLIENNTNLIREAIYADTNYLFPTSAFENDIQAICGSESGITSIIRLIENRKKGLVKEYSSMNYTSKPIERPLKRADLVINEIMANASDTVNNGDDWIELFNNTSDIIPLNKVWISDDSLQPLKYNIPRIAAIKPNGFITIWADNKNKKNGLHANFKLAANGETLLLSHEQYDTLDQIRFGFQFLDSSFARYPNGTGAFRIMTPTLNSFNIRKIPGDITENSTNDLIAVYPNPAVNSLFVEFKANIKQANLSIFDMVGNPVVSCSLKNGSSIDVSGLKAGVYLIHIGDATNSFTVRFVKL